MTLTQISDEPANEKFLLTGTNEFGAPAVALAVQEPDAIGVWLMPQDYETYAYPFYAAQYAQVSINDLIKVLELHGYVKRI